MLRWERWGVRGRAGNGRRCGRSKRCEARRRWERKESRFRSRGVRRWAAWKWASSACPARRRDGSRRRPGPRRPWRGGKRARAGGLRSRRRGDGRKSQSGRRETQRPRRPATSASRVNDMRLSSYCQGMNCRPPRVGALHLQIKNVELCDLASEGRAHLRLSPMPRGL